MIFCYFEVYRKRRRQVCTKFAQGPTRRTTVSKQYFVIVIIVSIRRRRWVGSSVIRRRTSIAGTRTTPFSARFPSIPYFSVGKRPPPLPPPPLLAGYGYARHVYNRVLLRSVRNEKRSSPGDSDVAFHGVLTGHSETTRALDY